MEGLKGMDALEYNIYNSYMLPTRELQLAMLSSTTQSSYGAKTGDLPGKNVMRVIPHSICMRPCLINCMGASSPQLEWYMCSVHIIVIVKLI